MTTKIAWHLAAVLGLCACRPTVQPQPESRRQAPAAPSSIQAAPAANVALPDDRTPLAEPHGTIDPKSAEAAGQVVQQYAALLEERKDPQADALWGSAAEAERFRSSLGRYSSVHFEIGKPGDTDGAAGSIYDTVPVIVYGTLDGGADFRRAAQVILRRVNDVPGSTDAQRRWHIERIDWDAG